MSEKSQAASLITEAAGLIAVFASAFGQWATQNHDFIWSVGILGGLFVAVIGCVFNVYYMRRNDKRLDEKHKLEMRRLEKDKEKK